MQSSMRWTRQGYCPVARSKPEAGGKVTLEPSALEVASDDSTLSISLDNL